MKNTLYFNSDFSVDLLENVEDSINSIFLNIKTSSALNQKLDIKVREVITTVDLASGVTTNYELAGTFWASGGNTDIRLRNNDGIGPWISIEFPETLSTDATLLEVDATHYKFNGQENEEEELKTKVIAYRNLREYNIGSELVKVVEIKFASVLENTAGVFNTTINFEASGIVDSATVTARIRANRAFDELFIPMQIVKNGKHVLTISYPVLDIVQDNSNQIDVYLQIDSGEITIEQGNLLASLVASGITGASGFSGEIDVLDVVEAVDLEEITVGNSSEVVSVDFLTPERISILDAIATITLDEIIFDNGITEMVRTLLVNVPLLRVLEDDSTERVTEDGEYYRYTESEEV